MYDISRHCFVWNLTPFTVRAEALGDWQDKKKGKWKTKQLYLTIINHWWNKMKQEHPVAHIGFNLSRFLDFQGPGFRSE